MNTNVDRATFETAFQAKLAGLIAEARESGLSALTISALLVGAARALLAVPLGGDFMATFIILTNSRDNLPMLINLEHLVAILPEADSKRSIVLVPGSGGKDSFTVNESVEDIMKMFPKGTVYNDGSAKF